MQTVLDGWFVRIALFSRSVLIIVLAVKMFSTGYTNTAAPAQHAKRMLRVAQGDVSVIGARMKTPTVSFEPTTNVEGQAL